MSKIYQYKSLQASVKDVDGKKGIVTGYFSAFNNIDSDGDVIRKGAFSKSISENGPKSSRPRIKHFLNHNPYQPLGVLIDLKEDDYGLYYESKIGDHILGKDFLKMVDSGLVTEHSIGFKTIKEQPIQGANEMTELQLREGSSLTAWGANEYTPLIGRKGTIDIDLIEKQKKQLEHFVKNSDVSDETIELLEIQIKQLLQFIQDATEPNNDSLSREKKERQALAIRLLDLKIY